jgi:hypothetical protein
MVARHARIDVMLHRMWVWVWACGGAFALMMVISAGISVAALLGSMGWAVGLLGVDVAALLALFGCGAMSVVWSVRAVRLSERGGYGR